MKLLESFLSALNALRANKMRSGLTMLGVIIGVGFVILLVSLGSGARAEITQGIQGLGSNLIIVMPFKVELDINANPMQQSSPVLGLNKFSLRIVEELGRDLGDERSVGLAMRKSAYISYKTNSYFTIITGTGSNEFYIRELKTETGRYFNEVESDAAHSVIVLGKTVARALFGDENPLNKEVFIKGRAFKVIGLQEEKGKTFLIDQDAVAFVPYTVMMRIFGVSKPDLILIKAPTPESVSEYIQLVNKTLSRFLQKEDYTIITQKDALSFAQDITRILTYLLGGIAGVSLLVGGIGIMNIMLVSVTERTREIGIRKAVGAKTRDILLQFLVEAVTLSVIGGIIGIGVAILGSALYEWILKLRTEVTPWIIVLAFFFSMIVGIFFGVYPARKASKLDPIESLRYE